VQTRFRGWKGRREGGARRERRRERRRTEDTAATALQSRYRGYRHRASSRNAGVPPLRVGGFSDLDSEGSILISPMHSARPGELTAKALFDHEPDREDELRFRQGDLVVVTAQHDSRGDGQWWRGTVDGRAGLFPATYVEVIPGAPSHASGGGGGGSNGWHGHAAGGLPSDRQDSLASVDISDDEGVGGRDGGYGGDGRGGYASDEMSLSDDEGY
jgi:hypothetical protein